MAEILCGAEPAAAAAGAVSEVVAACEPPIVRATRKRRMEYARRYGSSRAKRDAAKELLVGVVSGGVGEEDEERGQLLLRRLHSLVPGSLPEGELLPRAPGGADHPPGYGMASMRGRRRDMEDAVSIRPDFMKPRSEEEDKGDDDLKGLFHYYGVFDGHGCSHVAVSCKDRMHDLISDELRPQLLQQHSCDWKGAMGRGFQRMDREVVLAGTKPSELSCGCKLQEASKCDHVGSTAVVAVVTGDKVVVANCGDSRAVMCRKGVPVPLSEDHKPDRPDELHRIQAAGGRVIYWDGARVLGVLAMSRAIGDSHLKPYVTSEPEVTVTPRTDSDEFLILASDGLWDVVSNATACQVVRMCFKGNRSRATFPESMLTGGPAPTPSADDDGSIGDGRKGLRSDTQRGSDKVCLEAAVLLAKLALARGSGDNVSVVVVDLRKKKKMSSR